MLDTCPPRPSQPPLFGVGVSANPFFCCPWPEALDGPRGTMAVRFRAEVARGGWRGTEVGSGLVPGPGTQDPVLGNRWGN